MQWLRVVLVSFMVAGFLAGCDAQPPETAKKEAPVSGAEPKYKVPKHPDVPVEVKEAAKPDAAAKREAPAERDDAANEVGEPDGEISETPPPAPPRVEALNKAPPVAEKNTVKKPRFRQFEVHDAEKEGFHKVRVFYGTNRNQTGNEEANYYYGKTRGSMTFGVCEVAIPLTHVEGKLEAPKWWKMEFSEDPTKHVMLQKVRSMSWKALASELNETLARSSGRNAFVFVHGYNVSFKDAARRTAQIHHDLKFDGAPIFFSWPSRGEITLTSYTHDETNAKWSYSYLKDFLVRVATNTDADNIYLVAHSMGTRVLSNAVANIISERPDLKKRFKEIILAAPDIDADVFINDLAPKLVEASRNTTLYAASDDRALQTSREVHGGYPRAGDAGNNLIILKGIDTVDATGVDVSLLRHSYFAEANSIIRDIKEIVGLAKPARERTYLLLNKRENDGLEFFTVKK